MLFVLLTQAIIGATINVETTLDTLTNGDGLCSLREAITSANADAGGTSGCENGSGADLILVPAGVYVLTLGAAGDNANAGGDLDITTAMTIQGATGPTGTTIRGAVETDPLTPGIDRIFDIQDVGTNIVTLRQLKIANGKAPSTEDGGAIRSAAFLRVESCTVSDSAGHDSNGAPGGGGGIVSTKVNGLLVLDSSVAGNRSGDTDCNSGSHLADSGIGIRMSGGRIAHSLIAQNLPGTFTIGGTCAINLGPGGGVYNSGGALTIEDSSISGNSGGEGGGVYSSGATTIVRSAFITNHASGSGAAVFVSDNTLTLENATLTLNTADSNGGALHLHAIATPRVARVSHCTIVDNDGGGVEAFGVSATATVRLRNTLLAGNANAAMTPGFDCAATSLAALASDGYNVLGTGAACVADPLTDRRLDNVTNVLVDDTLAPGPNGTASLPPIAGSAIIDTGVCTNALGDAITVDQGGLPRACLCDIGAAERQTASVRIADEAAGINCASGGKRVETLDCSGAVLQTGYVCGSASGTPGPPGASGVTGNTGAPGVTGPQGASGADGHSGTLLLTEKIGTGDQACVEGGVRIVVGNDTDLDGGLTGLEITQTQVLCNPPQPRGGCGASGSPFAWALPLLLVAARRRKSIPSGMR